MSSTDRIFEIALEQLRGRTSAGLNIFSPRDFPTWDGNYPVLFVEPPIDEGQSRSGPNGPPEFTSTATLVVIARHAAPASGVTVPFDEGAAILRRTLAQLSTQIQRALVNNPAFWRDNGHCLLQEWSSYRVAIRVDASGELHTGEVTVTFGMIYVRGPEEFFCIDAPPLKSFNLQVVEPNGTTVPGFITDLPQ